MKTLATVFLAAAAVLAPMVVSAADVKKPASAAPAAPEVKKLEEPVEGFLFTRKNGGYMNLKVQDNNFVVSFYNEKKEEVKTDLEKVIIRFRRFGRDARYLLAPGGDGLTMKSSLHVERPYRFTLTVLTFKAGKEEADESFVQLFHQPMKGDGESVSGDELTPEQAQKVQK